MPSAIALCTTRSEAAKSMRPPKLLPPSPTTDTSSAEAPSLRFFIVVSSRAGARLFRQHASGRVAYNAPQREEVCAASGSLRARKAKDLARFIGRGDLSPEPTRY